jgi:hypothetical protein
MNKFLNVVLIIAFCILGAKYADKQISKKKSSDFLKSIEDTKLSTSEILNTTVYIYGIGNYKNQDLKDAERVIKSYYGGKCKIEGEKHISESDYKDHHIISDNIFNKFKNLEKSQMFVTSDKLYSSRRRRIVSGQCSYVHNCMIATSNGGWGIEGVTKHEYGHRLGLVHCKDIKCIMYHEEADEYTGELCKKCKNKINKK